MAPATLLNEFFEFLLNIRRKDSAAILRNPYEVIGDRKVCIAGGTMLQKGMRHDIHAYNMNRHVSIVPLKGQKRRVYEALVVGIGETARVWNFCAQKFYAAMEEKKPWPTQTQLQEWTKGGNYQIHSQTVQMTAKVCLTAFHEIQKKRKTQPQHHYPRATLRQYSILWPAQAVKVKGNRMVLPMGKGRISLRLDCRLEFPFEIGAVKIVWKDGWELHVTGESKEEVKCPGEGKACTDLGEIHQTATVTDGKKALVVSGRGIRTIKRQRQMALGEIARKRAKCQKGSRRYRKLQRARRKISSRTKRRVLDLRHKGLRAVVNWLVEEKVGTLYIGNPDGVRKRRSGRHHNDRLAKWEYGQDITLLSHKCEGVGIAALTGNERGTSSQCPHCQHKQRPKGRTFTCQSCGSVIHRDVMGGANQHPIAYGTAAPIPLSHDITYRRPGSLRSSRSSLDTGPCCLKTDQSRNFSHPGVPA